MSDFRALPRFWDEFVWSVRRAGIRIATSQAIDMLRTVAIVGIEDRGLLRDALGIVLISSREERERFETAFDDFFAQRSQRRSLFDRLRDQGFTDTELDAFSELLSLETESNDSVGALLDGGPALEQLMQLAGIQRILSSLTSPLHAGFFSQRVVDRLGVSSAFQKVALWRRALFEILGARGDELATALEKELERSSAEVRARIRHRAEERTKVSSPRSVDEKSFASLARNEIEEVRQAVRSFAARLRGAERARKKRAHRGRVDAHRTLRGALRTGGIPFSLARKKRSNDRPRLVVLCDVSDSVRSVATFLLEFTHAAQDLFSETRSFVFISALGETTKLFARERIDRAVAIAYGGGVVPVTDNSNYGRVFRTLLSNYETLLDRRTTVVVLGDGRSNYHDDAAEVLDTIRQRVRALIWLCPEPRAAWASGDSAMAKYSRACTEVLQVQSAHDLESAGRRILARR